MSTTLSIPRPASRRNQALAAASGLVAAAAVAVTLAVAAGGDGNSGASAPSAAPATASPNAATLYRNESAVQSGPVRHAGANAADRFHHFR